MTSSSQANNQDSSASTGGNPDFKHNLNMSEFVQVDRKVFFAAAERNKGVILDQLKPYLEKARLVLEVGSGSGQHTHHFSEAFPNVTFQPTEYDVNLLPSIEDYSRDLNQVGHHIKTPLELDATKQEHWLQVLKSGQEEQQKTGKDTSEEGKGCYDLVMTTNVFHISPWIVSQSIIQGAGQVLKKGGFFVAYGPFKRNGVFSTETNREFDNTLRGRNPSWGVRDLEEIEAVAKNEAGMILSRVVDMPSNNYMVFFEKQ
ncbi:hypothetical protein BG011_006437 [Mortierella polycephala]|uniref:Uncharacterized protein n=1 Tax=Mortierella polycephala TaxID=41804 RepID=A0A9P6TZK6_9FUNG|nr:hypothetical protein BG011_006437 [Mortierella polycephala]